MSKESLLFADEQVDAMIQARGVIQALDTALHDYQSYDPEQDKDLPPHLGSMDKRFHDRGFKDRILELGPSQERQRLHLQRFYGDSQPKPLSKTRGKEILNSPNYAAYCQLQVDYIGKVALCDKDGRDSDDHTIYVINRPHTLLHGLGVIISARMTLKHELMPIEGGLLGNLTYAVAIAAERLHTAASHTEDPEERKKLQESAKAASTQRFIHSTTLQPVYGWRLATAGDARQLAGLITSALAYGKDAKS